MRRRLEFEAIVSPKRTARSSGSRAQTQTDLFETAGQLIKSAPRNEVQRSPPIPSQVMSTRTILECDVPLYDDDEIQIVDASIAELPASKLWFTYADIRRYFGVSRATIARKLKAGLVPGIRFQGNRVIEEGAVRRLSRMQVRFVLLAVRRRNWRSSVY